MSETLWQIPRAIAAPDGRLYEARACGSVLSVNTWQGWIEFVPIDGGEPIRSPRETTQPNRKDTVYWATGLTDVYLEGALRRALEPPPSAALTLPPQPSVFARPAPAIAATRAEAPPASILDPFSVYEKGEPLLRRQLAAFSAWHLVNIAREYRLTDLSVDALNRMPAAQLIELIVLGVQRDIARRHRV